MTKSEMIQFFGSQRQLADILNLRQPSISDWSENQVPGHYQLIAQRLSQGQLQASPEAYSDVVERVRTVTHGLIRLTVEEVEKRARQLRIKLVHAD